jgi:antitoxin (DNA-binding transcriptional repressor) of toxin-antitoxin stability system
MKTLTVTQAKPRLAELVDEVHAGSPVILVHNEKLVKIERYVPFDPNEDSPELEAMLLEAVRGPHAAYSAQEMKDAVRQVSSARRKK